MATANAALEAVAFLDFIEKHENDPLLTLQPTRIQREFFRWISDLRDLEVYWRSGNSGAKTFGGALASVVIARADPALCKKFGLPYIKPPVTGWILTQSYKQQVDASQAALFKVLGKHPHYVSWVSGEGKNYAERVYIATPKCKHGMGDHCDHCSRVSFHAEESKSSIGGRIDFAWADEPPAEKVWREMRGRTTANKRLLMFITATPLEQARWWWLQEDFSDLCLVYASAHVTGGEEKRGEPFEGRAEIRSTIYDNDHLSNEHIERQLLRWKGDQLLKARIKGEYVDSSGECPFNIEVLDRWSLRCKPGSKETIHVLTEIDRAEGRIIIPTEVEVETWWKPEPDEDYLLVADLSSGIKARGYDPAALVILARRRPRVVAVYNGYLASYGMGCLSAILARRYNNALVMPEMNGGWGKPFLTALMAQKYSNIHRDQEPDKPGGWNARLGFRNTHANKAQCVGAMQHALLEDSIEVLSRDVVSQCRSVVIGKTDKGLDTWAADKGKKDDLYIAFSEGVKFIYTYPLKPRPKHNGIAIPFREKRIIPKAPKLLWRR